MAQTNQACGMFCDSKMPPAPTPPDGLAGAEALSAIYNLKNLPKWQIQGMVVVHVMTPPHSHPPTFMTKPLCVMNSWPDLTQY